MKRYLGSVRALFGAALLAAASATGCTTIIGLEIGELDESTGGGGASVSSVSAGGEGGEGGAGTGGAGTAGGDTGGGGTGGSGEEALCSYVREGATRAPSGEWGTLAGRQVIDIKARAGAVTALVNKEKNFSVARWSDSGTLDSEYSMEASELAGRFQGEHVAIASEMTYVTGAGVPGVDVPVLVDECAISARADSTPTPTFLMALDEKGACAWAWSVDGESNSSPLGLAATPEQIVFAAALSGRTVASTNDCLFGSDSAKTSAELIAFNTAGRCQWSRSLGTLNTVHIASVLIDTESQEVLVVGDYKAPNGPIEMQGRPLPSSQESDLFIARVRLADGKLSDVITINVPGFQAVARRGAALLPGGDVVISGTYLGPSFDFEDECPSMPSAGIQPTSDALGTGNTFIVRVGRSGLVWSRGFGDDVEDQLVISVAVDEEGSIYATGTLEGEIDLGDGMKLAAPADQLASFLLVLSDHGNVLSASELVGEGMVWAWAVAPGPTLRDPLYVAGELTQTFYLVPSDHSSDDRGEGFIARIAGMQ
ncbi:hypothetical protein WMF37_35165 [Sorangium sp. So ce291]|uniref:hypothetical protein n=1 Tax=Sorangium sp. So ce291 TaxID=3133294 RepID=UPI003F5E6CA8